MLEYLPRAFATILRQHQAPLLLATLILTAGIVTGALRVAQLDPGQQVQVGQYLDYLVATAAGAGEGAGPRPEGVGAGDPAAPGEGTGGSGRASGGAGAAEPGPGAGGDGTPGVARPAWGSATGGNLRQVAVAWAAGCLVLGLPVTLGVLFLHGYSLGFAVGAMAAHWHWRGLVVALAAVFPTNLLQVPALVLVAAAATRLAGQVAVSRVRRGLPSLASPWSPYLALGAVAALLALGAGWLEAAVAPALLQLVHRFVL
ncbi:protein of unknown function DUF95 transmembrane [Thermaerobacter marianensis DSM 12885]|uniref:Stage II sporulation protein M n=1 Tax=Thermaerobacter marianensis (strain ATCC 700841 / DSM 12885 / JCM 10246 / 7p75a) TaxID=644966 RepID=E6SKQ2_THEM7|nr:stage II sporulation protein M [Thermaerobacter marianensis]ADU51260.1 protein of unknown function DUF95 transmembrane [Thermaerobacter marianensis DSM 12885]